MESFELIQVYEIFRSHGLDVLSLFKNKIPKTKKVTWEEKESQQEDANILLRKRRKDSLDMHSSKRMEQQEDLEKQADQENRDKVGETFHNLDVHN